MPTFTSELNLYKPGGGSTGLILPDEVVDIDRINANMELLDDFAVSTNLSLAALGKLFPRASSRAARDAIFTVPVAGDMCRRTDTGLIETYNGTGWRVVPGQMLAAGVFTSSTAAANTEIGKVKTPVLEIGQKTLTTFQYGASVAGSVVLTTAVKLVNDGADVTSAATDARTFRDYLSGGGSVGTFTHEHRFEATALKELSIGLFSVAAGPAYYGPDQQYITVYSA